jgi:ATP-dependent DNA helicase RecQ
LKSEGQYGGLALNNEIARPILRGEESIQLRADATAELEKGNTSRSRQSSPATELPEDKQALFAALRKWRLDEAREQEIPPYVIFHDAALKDIAVQEPSTLEALGEIKGVGRSKLERYGKNVLAVIAASHPGQDA